MGAHNKFVEEKARKEKKRRKREKKKEKIKRENKGKGKEIEKEEGSRRFLSQFIGVPTVATRWTKD